MSDDAIRLPRDCLTGARLLWKELRDLFGHVSCRRPDGRGFWLAMVRVSPDPATRDEVMGFDYEGNKISGEQSPPYEIHLHTEILRARPDIASVVHCHPHVAVALSMAGKTVHAVSHQSARFGAGIPVFSKSDFIRGAEIGRELAECLGSAPAAALGGADILAESIWGNHRNFPLEGSGGGAGAYLCQLLWEDDGDRR